MVLMRVKLVESIDAGSNQSATGTRKPMTNEKSLESSTLQENAPVTLPLTTINLCRLSPVWPTLASGSKIPVP